MSTRTFALLFGIVFLAVGVLGFVPGLLQPLHDGHPAVTGSSGQLLGLFPVNEVHNGVHILCGVAIIYAVLTVAGLVPALNTGFGFVPLYGNNIWLHAALALVAAYFGWVNRSPSVV
jgi:hypothetical protein